MGSKLEKRKPSVTQIRKSSEVSAESSGHSSLVTTEPEQEQIERSKTSSSEPYDLQHKTETTADSYITKSPTSSPPPSSSDKKIPSPTKIRPPIQSTASLKEQISEEILSPSLEVECHTPEKTMLSGKGKEISKEDEVSEEAGGLAQLVDAEIKQTKIQHAQSSSYDDTATTSSEFEQRVEVTSTGKRSRTSSSSSAKSVASTDSSKGSKHSVASSRGISKSNPEEVAEQELLDEMIVRDVSDNLGTDPGAASTTHDIINEEEEGEADDKVDNAVAKQQGDLSDHGHSESDDVTSSNEDIANQPKQGPGNEQ